MTRCRRCAGPSPYVGRMMDPDGRDVYSCRRCGLHFAVDGTSVVPVNVVVLNPDYAGDDVTERRFSLLEIE